MLAIMLGSETSYLTSWMITKSVVEQPPGFDIDNYFYSPRLKH